ncbi:DHHA1 domain protein [Bulleidia extructa W1219]|uniref:Cyclic-di-AMP phosphodiesterase n=1 Tax=Bulleidia extructa W1219 TaxID=679192 RepID=D2MMB3_9FIRM|nr:DHH family phosphoesterase [Bulleidia extructa]EFC06189.1 DHHA1 domain protein [Bulleidia extructa W1219]
MKEKLSQIQRMAAIVIGFELIVTIALGTVFKMTIWPMILVIVVEVVLLVWCFDYLEKSALEETTTIERVLGKSAMDGYRLAKLGMVVYDENYVVIQMSDLFKDLGIDRIGYKLLSWIPEANDLLSGAADISYVSLDGRVYELTRQEEEPIIFFKDVTDLNQLKDQLKQEKIVIAIAHFDNYEESTLYADEGDIAFINASIRTPLNVYAQEHKMFLRRLSNNRYLMVLNEKIYEELVEDKFSILRTIRKAANAVDVSITLSMAFAKGTSNFLELDEMVTKLLDLAQTRGGDQVAIQTKGEEVQFFGGSSEATEKRSRVRVRVISHALRDLILNSSNVIVAGHKDADFDCIGSALAVAKMTMSLGKDTSIIAKTGGLEEKVSAALEQHLSEFEEEGIHFISENEALNELREETLVIMVDHHNVQQSNGSKVEEQAKKVVIIDHHRRSSEMGVKPILMYIEAAASSANELVSEMIPYVAPKADISPLDASFMMAGMIIDTRQWRVRTGSRTYDAASIIRSYGGDPQVAYGYLKETYEEFQLKNQVMSNAERYEGGIVIALVSQKRISRSMMSQIADQILSVQGSEAAFVIANDEQGLSCISARSNGNVNVQRIMEKLGGGGHLSAAAVQRNDLSIEDLKTQLIQQIQQEGGNRNESDLETGR